MTPGQIRDIQKTIGTTADGIWGPKSIATAQAYLRSLMPEKSPWPTRANARAFYGQPGDTKQHTRIDVAGLGIEYDGQSVKSITCHAKIADSLKRILTELSTTTEGRSMLKKYAGVYNNRSIRGGTATSIHAFAAAIDLDPGNNGNHTHWPLASTMPFSVMIAFAREGWFSAGAFWHRDAMHFEAIAQ